MKNMEILVDNDGLSHICLDIFANLDPSNLAQCRLVCKSWCMLVTSSRVWWKSMLSQFELKTKTTKRIEGENGFYVLMPRNHKRWNYWKKAIKHFDEKENLEYLERFTLFLLREVPFVQDITKGNLKQPKDQLAGFETESLTIIDKLWKDGDHKLAKKILSSFYKVSDYTKPLNLAVQNGLHNMVHVLVLDLVSIGIDLNKPLPKIEGFMCTDYYVPIITLLAQSSRREQILEMLKYFLGLGLDINAKDHWGCSFLHWLLMEQKYKCKVENGELTLDWKEPKSDNAANIEDELFDFLLSNENLDIYESDPEDPLNYAIFMCKDKWIQALLQRRNTPLNWRHIHYACYEGRLNVVKMLLRIGNVQF